MLDEHVSRSSKGLWRGGQQALALLRRALLDLREALFPARCSLCERRVSGDPFCPGCLEGFLRAPQGALVSAPFSYAGGLAEALRQAKFRPDERAARALATLFASAVTRPADVRLHDVEWVTWVPLHPRRLRSRGFDLAALFAQALARRHKLPCEPLLRCVRHDLPLSRGADIEERARRVSGRYRALPAAAGRRVLLVDDVVTTGATLQEARRTLEEAEAASVELLAFAATPRASSPRPCHRQGRSARHFGAGSPDQSWPRSINPQSRKSASSDQSG